MYKRKFEHDLVAVTSKKIKIQYCPGLTLDYCKQHEVFLAAPEPLKKRKRSEECEEADSKDREARRIKSSHSGSNRLNPHILSPASKYQIFSKTDSEEEKYWEGRTALPRSSTPDNLPTSAAKETTTTPDTVLAIRLARPQEHSPAPISPSRKEKKSGKKSGKKSTQAQTTTATTQQQQKQKQKQQRKPKIPAQIQKSVPKTKSRPYYSSMLELLNAADDRYESEWTIR